MIAKPDFGAEPFALGEARGVAIRGELDLDAAPGVTALVDEAIRTSRGTFVIDLSQLGFMDSTGLTLFIRARALLGQADRAIAVICPPGQARRVFEAAGVADLFSLFGSREEALAGGVGLRESATRAVHSQE